MSVHAGIEHGRRKENIIYILQRKKKRKEMRNIIAMQEVLANH